mgnify:CR=1 FL=1
MENKVIILTDSTADLPLELIKSRNIYQLPLYVNFGDIQYKDGVDITPKALYEKVSETNMIPTTSAISPGDFINFFNAYKEEDIVYMGIGGSISGTLQSAYLAKETLNRENIYLVDSKNLSSGTGLLVLKASDYRDKGLSGSEIKAKLDLLVPKVRSQFAILTLDYLHKGGRASGTAKLVGTVLGLKPIIKVIDGKLEVYKKPAGKMSRALDIMIEDFNNTKIDEDYVFITHSFSNKVDYIKERINAKNIIVSEAGCVISSHCGAGTIGILYIEK